jgi:hypothetical protein
MQKHILLGRGRFVHKKHLIKHHGMVSSHGYGTAPQKKQGLGVKKHHIKPLKFIL